MSDLYSVKDVANLFGVQEARLRYWAQTGFIGPSVRQKGRFLYTFQDLIGVKVAKELLDGGLPMQRVRKNLDALRAALPHVDRPLSQLRICSDGNDLVVVADELAFQPATGQLVMSFTVGTLSARVAEMQPLRPAEPTALPSSAYACFLDGLAAQEDGDLGRAEALYRHAVELDKGFASAWTNLANLLERRSQRGEARAAYESALALEPDQPEARYNLANLLADLGEDELALGEYRRVTAASPGFADAHFNLALLLLRQGEGPQARIHLARYLELDGDSEWAAAARARLAELARGRS